MSDESKPDSKSTNLTRTPSDGLAAALLRIDELESVQEIHQNNIEGMIEKVADLEGVLKRHQDLIQELLVRLEKIEEAK